jgi:hypothetical protein
LERSASSSPHFVGWPRVFGRDTGTFDEAEHKLVMMDRERAVEEVVGEKVNEPAIIGIGHVGHSHSAFLYAGLNEAFMSHLAGSVNPLKVNDDK